MIQQKLHQKQKHWYCLFSTGVLTVHGKVAKENEGRFFITKILKDCLQYPHFNKDHHCTGSAILWNKDDTCSIKHLEVETPGTEECVQIQSAKSLPKKHNLCLWKKNRRKLDVNSGKSQNKKLKPPCNDKCRLTCNEVFNKENHKKIFDSYWELPSI